MGPIWPVRFRCGIAVVLRVDVDEESVEYDEDAARETFQRTFESIADTLSQGLSRQQRRELKEVADTMVSGGARGGGWFEFANA